MYNYIVIGALVYLTLFTTDSLPDVRGSLPQIGTGSSFIEALTSNEHILGYHHDLILKP